MCTNKYEQHQSDYREGIVRDFTDAMIFSQQNSLKSEKEPSNYSTNTNLGPSITQLFLGKNLWYNFTLQ